MHPQVASTLSIKANLLLEIEDFVEARETARQARLILTDELTEDHWQVLQLFRQYFMEYEIEPPMRALVRMVREQMGEDKGNSRFLYRLFPKGPVTQACRYAGLPRPVSCI
jgi:tRNA 2-thiouridine synthesizing protein E